MKVFNVDQGPFLNDIGEKTHTQDFTFNNAPILELTDLPTCVEIFTLREKYFDDKEGLTKELEKRPDKDLQFAPGQLPNQHFMSYTMYSQSAYRYGDNIAKFALFPSTKLQQDLAESAKITESSAPEWAIQPESSGHAETPTSEEPFGDETFSKVKYRTMEWW